MKDSVLFVDDEVNLLDSLKRSMRSKRGEWEMTFVTSAADALEAARRRCFDVVVTDMRMPEMDGADLLDEMKVICPRSVRIILSGQAEVDSIVKSVGSAHQYLSKPCDPEMLLGTIERSLRLRRTIGNAEIEQFVSGLQSIPSQPAVYDQIAKELGADSPSLDAIAAAVSSDIGMSAKLLQITNSSFFGHKRIVSSAREAVSILGLEIFKRLFESEKIFIRCDSGAIGTLDLARLHQRGTAVGNVALRVAALNGLQRSSAEMCSNTGLLCRIGCIVLSMYAPAEHQHVLSIGDECESSVEMERKIFNSSHSEIGAYLLGLWGLPAQFAEVAARHHACENLEGGNFSVLAAVQIAENIAAPAKYQSGECVERFEAHHAFRERLRAAQRCCGECGADSPAGDN